MPRNSLNCLPLMKTRSPGPSSQPASRPPSITVSAPAAMALAMSPENWMPPSAITGTPAGPAARAASYTAVICGTPTPATTLVVQIVPGPTPTLTASAPASIRAGDDVDPDIGLELGDHVEHRLGVAVRGVDHQEVRAR